jgi:hypothetical protein
VESHPEEDYHSKDQTKSYDALLGLFLCQFGLAAGSISLGTNLLGAALGVTAG